MLQKICISAYMLVLVLLPGIVWAQNPPMFPDAPNQTPIDGGIIGIVFASVTWAIHRLKKVKSKP